MSDHRAHARVHRVLMRGPLRMLHRRLGRSVFAKVVTVMVAMAACLLVLVAGFFFLYVNPMLGDAIDRDRVRVAHFVMLAVLLVLMAAIVVMAHAVLRHLLQPLRALGAGVARLGEGQLDVVVPRRSADEFGDLTDAFNRMVGRIREMIRARDQLLLDVSHELRSPVTRLKVAAELVSDRGLQSRMAVDLADMDIMIGELIELERLRDGHGLRPVRQNVVPLLTELARAYDTRPPGVRVAPTLADVEADIDADRMRTVLRNLVENAIKYSGPDSRPVELAAMPNGDSIVVRVTDDGPGIPESEIPDLFEPFFRVDRSRSKKTGGYGLGLSIAKRIVEAHGGTIAARNNRGRGASFVITLRKTAAAADTLAADQATVTA